MALIPVFVKEMTGLISFNTPINTEHSRSSVPKMRTRIHTQIALLPFLRVMVSLSII